MLKKKLQNIPEVNRLISNTWWYTELAFSNLLLKKRESMNVTSAFFTTPGCEMVHTHHFIDLRWVQISESTFLCLGVCMQLKNGLFWGNGTELGPQCSTCPLWPEGHVASSLYLNVPLSYWNRDSHWDKVQCLRSCSRTNNISIPAVCWIIWVPDYSNIMTDPQAGLSEFILQRLRSAP